MNQQAAGFILFYSDPKNQEKTYLLLQHAFGRHWGFPKGKIEMNESKQIAALRELKEETGIDGTFYDTFESKIEYSFADRDNNTIHKTVFYFIATADSKRVKLSSEHTDYVWLTYSQALEKLTHQRDQELLKEVNTYLEQL